MTVTSTFTSACRCSSTLCSPTTRSGPRASVLRCARLETELAERLGDVHGADRAEQLAFRAGLRLILRTCPRSSSRAACAASSSAAALASSSARRASNSQCSQPSRASPCPAGSGSSSRSPTSRCTVADATDVIDFLEQNHFHLNTLISRLRTNRRSQIEPIVDQTQDTDRQDHEHV